MELLQYWKVVRKSLWIIVLVVCWPSVEPPPTP